MLEKAVGEARSTGGGISFVEAECHPEAWSFPEVSHVKLDTFIICVVHPLAS